MALKITKVDVWAGTMRDMPGGLAGVLEPLGNARASLECVIARRQPEQPGTGTVFVSPVKPSKVQDAARGAGLNPATDIATLRVEGADQPGLGGRLTRAIADAGVNLRGLSAMALGNKFVAYFGFDNGGDADRAATAMKGVGGGARAGRSAGRTGSKRRATSRRR